MKKSLVLLIALALPACASLGLTTPKGFDQSLAEAYGVHTAVLSATAVAVSTGALSSSDATQVEQMARTARGFLDAARAAERTGNTAGASNELVLATSALAALQTFLNTKGGK